VKLDDDVPKIVENPTLDALIRTCLGLRLSMSRLRPTGDRALVADPADFEDTVPASYPHEQ
jgi:hypothetical protein